MVKIDTADLLKQLEELEKTITRKLEKTVRDFAGYIAVAAEDSTPVGNLQDYYSLYMSRENGWPQTPGMAVSNWSYAEDGSTLTYAPIADFNASSRVIGNASTQYNLGDNFVIYNNVPYIGMLEQGWSNQAPAGIVDPAMIVVKAYSINLQSSFDKA